MDPGLLCSPQANVSIPLFHCGWTGAHKPLQDVCGCGLGGPAPLAVPEWQVGAVWKGRRQHARYDPFQSGGHAFSPRCPWWIAQALAPDVHISMHYPKLPLACHLSNLAEDTQRNPLPSFTLAQPVCPLPCIFLEFLSEQAKSHISRVCSRATWQ